MINVATIEQVCKELEMAARSYHRRNFWKQAQLLHGWADALKHAISSETTANTPKNTT